MIENGHRMIVNLKRLEPDLNRDAILSWIKKDKLRIKISKSQNSSS